ncbi:MAG: thioredoxin [Gammaproteobacteria bacterium]
MSEHISHVTDANFAEEVLETANPVLVDFWAEWCAPCRAISPVLEETAKEYANKVKFVKLNVDNSTQTPVKYGVRGIPTLMLFKQGNVEATRVGALTKSQLIAFLDENI